MRKRIFIILIVILVLLLSSCQQELQEEKTNYKAKIIGITENTYEGNVTIQDVELEILEGPYAGGIFHTKCNFEIDHYKNFDFLNVKDKVLVYIWENTDSGEIVVSIMDHYRTPQLIILFFVFLAAIVAIAGKKGLKTVIALILTIVCIVFILIPMIAIGHNAIVWALICGLIVSSITLVIVGGINRKTLSAILGTFFGLLCAAVLTLIISQVMHISGIRSEDVELIAVSNIDFDLDIRGMFTAGIFIGCLGAVMDVGMSMASSIKEIKTANPEITKLELRKAGMRVGQDIMGTMSNTLILAYTGGALIQMVAWMVRGVSFLDMLNYEYIIIEIVRALAGSFGMLLTIPITCLIASDIITFDAEAFLQQQDLIEADDDVNRE